MQSLNKFGILITLVITNIVIWALIYQVNFSWNMETSSDFILSISVMFGLIIIIISGIIAYFNKKTNKLLEDSNKRLGYVSDELIKSERFSAIGELSSRLAHDIRNPLSIISVTLENLKLIYGTNEKLEKQFEKAHRAIFRIAHQLDDVLDFVIQRPLTLNKIKMSDVLADALDSIYIPNGIKLELPKNDVELLCDVKQLSVAVSNLILNGMQAMDNKGLLIISLDKKDNKIILEIEDSGKGILKKDLPHIFEPLFTTKQTGTGLGLASVKSIINSHMGTISVTSKPTVFTITLPQS